MVHRKFIFQMAKFTELIKSSKIQAAYLQRQATLDEIGRNVLLIKELDRENPNSRTFHRLESDANKLLDELKLADRELFIKLVKANPDINNDEFYKLIQNLYMINSFRYLRLLMSIPSCFTAKIFRILLMLTL